MTKVKAARSAKSGRFVRKGYAKEHPKTTVVERITRFFKRDRKGKFKK